MPTMQAAVIDAYKQPVPQLRKVPIPRPEPHDVLVKIKAASINPIDTKIQDGGLKLLLPYQFPLILGNDFAGVVAAVGSAVTNFTIGDAVFGRVPKAHIGTFAEYIAVDAAAITFKPKNLTFEEAAALPLVGLTSYQALHDIMHLRPEQKVLIQGGAGGVGTVAIQLAKQMGAYVATTTSAAHFDLVRALGADLPIDYHKTNFAEALTDYDAVFDTRGGQALADAFKIIRPGGKVVSISGLPNARFGREYGVSWWKQLLFGAVTRNLTKLERRTGGEYHFLFMKPSGAQLAHLRDLVEASALKPVIDRIVPLAAIADAFAYSRAGHATGKIIVRMPEED